jgi:ribonuclease HII
MAETKKTSRTKTGERIFSAENALLSLARPQTLFHSNAQDQIDETFSFISVDEVGRGCLAGPVVVCTTLWSFCASSDHLQKWYSQLRDSKKLSAAKRDALFNDFIQHDRLASKWNTPPPWRTQDHTNSRKTSGTMSERDNLSLRVPESVMKLSGVDVQRSIAARKGTTDKPAKMLSASIGEASAQEIDRFGIIAALGLAAARALDALPSGENATLLFFDGNRPLSLPAPWCGLPQLLVVKGDDHLKSISASSVIAKVVRDRWMENYSESFPEFGFDENRGYGTEAHRQALFRLGPTPLHRISFLKNLCPELSP